MPQEYYAQYTSRDVVSIVGYQDVDTIGDNYCPAQMQGGLRRRDRNLIWWKYINTLGRTAENVDTFPGSFSNLPDWSSITHGAISTKLIVVENATHSAQQVFESPEGQAALFTDRTMLPTGWRPPGWQASTRVTTPSTNETSGGSSNNMATSDARILQPSTSMAHAACTLTLVWIGSLTFSLVS